MQTDRLRIFSHITHTRFLHIEDSLERRKLRFFIGAYQQGSGASATAFTFLDVDDARVVLSDLSWGKQMEYVDFKGSKSEDGVITSRVLKITLTHAPHGAQRSAGEGGKCWVEIKNGPGEMINGVVKPKGRPTAEIQIPLSVFEARRLAHACLAYLAAWDVVGMMNAKCGMMNPEGGKQ
jgi:hypothetical protein